MATDQIDKHRQLRQQMRAAGRLVGPDQPISRPAGNKVTAASRRLFDLMLSSAVLVALALPLALIALAIRIDSSGSPIFRQRRVGLDGQEFELLKLRTMVDGAQQMGAGLAIEKNDARITRLGAFLRRSSIDELPQFWNVLKGQMSLIGPRPTVPSQVENYDQFQRERLLIKPGLTGWAQVQGRTGITWPERIEFDRWYVANRTVLTDLKILLATVRVVLTGEGVSRDGAAWR